METTESIRERRALTRPHEGRWVGGVCAGLGAYFDLNPALYRIAFAALTFAGGTGLALYAVAWLVIPEEGAEDSIAAAELRRHRDHPARLLGLALIAVIAVSAISSARLWPSPGNLWVAAALVLVGLAWWRGRLLAGIVVGLALVVAAGLLFAIRVPVFSGIGDRVEHPALASEVHSRYELGIGNLDLDFRDVRLPKGETFVRADVGIGALHVTVPRDATVDARGSAQAGDVRLLDDEEHGTNVHAHVVDRTGSGRVLVLDLRTGLGKVDVRRP